jgi:hypothetical protein
MSTRKIKVQAHPEQKVKPYYQNNQSKKDWGPDLGMKILEFKPQYDQKKKKIK